MLKNKNDREVMIWEYEYDEDIPSNVKWYYRLIVGGNIEYYTDIKEWRKRYNSFYKKMEREYIEALIKEYDIPPPDKSSYLNGVTYYREKIWGLGFKYDVKNLHENPKALKKLHEKYNIKVLNAITRA